MGIAKDYIPEGIYLTSVDEAINWARSNSVFYLLFGTACCAIELMQTGGPRGDFERFGSLPRASPRQSDLMIFAGTITYKMALRAKQIFEQMAEPRYVLAMGSCANCGGLFQPGYAVVKGVDLFVPVDAYIPGCPPRPEALLDGLMKIQQKMRRERFLTIGEADRTPEVSRDGIPGNEPEGFDDRGCY